MQMNLSVKYMKKSNSLFQTIYYYILELGVVGFYCCCFALQQIEIEISWVRWCVIKFGSIWSFYGRDQLWLTEFCWLFSANLKFKILSAFWEFFLLVSWSSVTRDWNISWLLQLLKKKLHQEWHSKTFFLFLSLVAKEITLRDIRICECNL